MRLSREISIVASDSVHACQMLREMCSRIRFHSLSPSRSLTFTFSLVDSATSFLCLSSPRFPHCLAASLLLLRAVPTKRAHFHENFGVMIGVPIIPIVYSIRFLLGGVKECKVSLVALKPPYVYGMTERSGIG